MPSVALLPWQLWGVEIEGGTSPGLLLREGAGGLEEELLVRTYGFVVVGGFVKFGHIY